MDLREYVKGDYAKVRARARDDLGYFNEAQASFDTAFTIWSGDEAVACGGLVVSYPGVGGLWAIVGDSARGNGLEFTRLTRKGIHLLMDSLGVWRAQATIQAGINENARWAKILGMEYESTLKCAAPDKGDMLMYRLLRNV